METEYGKAKIIFYDRPEAIKKPKCSVYDEATRELLVECRCGESVEIDCPKEVCIRKRGYFGKPKKILEAGNTYYVVLNTVIGKVSIHDEEPLTKNDIEHKQYMDWLDTIQSVSFIDSKDEAPKVTTKQSGVSTAARAVLGGALLGDLGAIAGAASTKRKTTITQGKRTYKFYVLYKDGTDDILVLNEGEKCDDLLKLSYRQKTE